MKLRADVLHGCVVAVFGIDHHGKPLFIPIEADGNVSDSGIGCGYVVGVVGDAGKRLRFAPEVEEYVLPFQFVKRDCSVTGGGEDENGSFRADDGCHYRVRGG